MNRIAEIVCRTGVTLLLAAICGALVCHAPQAAAADLPHFDHVVVVLEENKDYEQVIGIAAAPYINDTLKAQGANLTQMYGEEHHSEGNYFWLFSGSDQGVGFNDAIPSTDFTASSLGQSLITAHRTFKGYSEDLPAIGSKVDFAGLYARKHVPWISFSNIPNGATVDTSSNLRFADFPSDYTKLPTVAFVIPNLVHDMHNGTPPSSVDAGDKWLRKNLDGYYQWAKKHNSLLIVTFDEDSHGETRLTNPGDADPAKRNRIPTIIAGAHVKHGEYAEGKGVTHVNILRTVEAIYGLPKSGAQQQNALAAGISDDFVIQDIFEATGG
jgi:phosphatidylinositol-3-phosphatase